MPDPDDFMTLTEVASIPKLNHQTVRNWVEGETPGAPHRSARPHPAGRLDTLAQRGYSGRSKPTAAKSQGTILGR
jgi:hypothetical protein